MSDQIVHLQIDMDGSRAEKAWKRLIQSIEADEAQLAEMRKKNMQDTDEYKQVQERLKLEKTLRQDIKVHQVNLAAEIEHIATQSLNRLESLARGVQKQLKSIDPTKEYEKLAELSRYLGIIQREMESRQQLQQQLSQRTAEAIIRESHLTQEQIAQESLLGSAYRTAQQDRQKFEQKIQTLTDSHVKALEKEKSMNIDIADLEQQRAAVAAKVAQLSVARDAEVTKQLVAQEQVRDGLEQHKQNLQQQRIEKEQKYNALLKSRSEVEQRIANYQQQIANAEAKNAKADTWHQALGEAQTLLTGIKNSLTATNDEIGTIDRRIAATNTEYQKSLDETRQLHTQLTLINTTEQDIEREEKKLADMREAFRKATMDEQIQMQASIREQDELVKKLKQNYDDRINQQKALEEATKKVGEIEKQISDLQAKKPKNADEAKYQKRLATLNQNYEEAKKVEAAAKQALDTMVAGATAAGNAFQLPHDHLKRLRDELQHVINNSTDKSAIEKWSLELAEMDATLRRMELAPVRDLNVVLAEVGNAKSITQMSMLSDELKKIFDRLKDPELRNQAKAAFEGLDASIAQTKLTMRDQEQIMQEYAHAQELIRQGTSANAEEVRRHIAVMRECEASDKIDLAMKQQIAGSIREMDALYKGNATTTMTAAEAETVFNRAQTLVAQGATAKASEVREVNRLMKEAVLVSDLNIETENRYAQMVKQTDDLLAGKIAVSMNAAQAEQTLADATRMLSVARTASINGAKLEADAFLRLRDSVQQALNAQGLTLAVRNQLMASDRELEQLLRAENVTTMSQVEAEQVLAEAKQRLVNIDHEQVSVITNLIQQLTLARNAKGVEIVQSREMAEVQKQMQDAMTKTEKKYMDLAEAEKVAANAAAYDERTINQAIEALKNQANKEQDLAKRTELIEKYKKLEEVQKKIAKTQNDMVYGQEEFNNTMRNVKTAPIKDLERALKAVQEEIKKVDTNSKAFAKMSNEATNLKKKLDEANAQMGKTTQHLKDQDTWFGKAATKLMSYIGIFGGFYMVRQQLTQAFQANLKYDDSLSNIRKTTGLTAESVAMLADNIKRINTRTALQEMNDLAYSAGKLGVKGVSDVMGFVRAADQVKIALGEQLGDNSQAIEQLMKISSIMGVQDEHGLEDAILRVGSSINHLTMNSQATAQPIVDFMKRIAGVSTQAGVTASELAGLAGAVSALGQPVEMSATSISKMFVQISGHSKQVAEALKMTAKETEDFMYNISTGQMMEAFLTVLRKTNEGGGLSHLSGIVKDLGSNGQRVIQTIATLSENYDMVAKMVRMSNQAFEEGVSVTDEYNLKQQNTAALWEKLKNNFSKLFVSTEAVGFIRGLLVSVQKLPAALRQLADSFSFFISILKAGVYILTEYTWAISGLLKAMLMRQAVAWLATAFQALATGAKTVGTAFKASCDLIKNVAITTSRLLVMVVASPHRAWQGFKLVVRSVTSSMQGLATFLKSASFGNAFTAIATIGFMAWDHFTSKAREFEEALKDNIKLLADVRHEFNETTTSINSTLDQLNRSWDNTNERRKIIDQINSTYGTYLGHLLDESMGYDAIEASLRAVNRQLKLKSDLEGKAEMEKRVDEKYRDELGAMEQKLMDAIEGTLHSDNASAMDAAVSNIVNALLKKQTDGTRAAASMLSAVRKGGLPDGEILKYIPIQHVAATTGDDAVDQVHYQYNQRYRKQVETPLSTLFAEVLADKNGEVTLLSKMDVEKLYDIIAPKLQEYLNQEIKIENEKKRNGKAWNRAIGEDTDALNTETTKTRNELFTAIQGILTMGGKMNREVSLRTEDGEMKPWLAELDKMTTKQKVNLAKDLDDYIRYDPQYLRMLTGQGKQYKPNMAKVAANETDEYNQEEAYLANAIQLRKLIKVGKIKNPEEKDTQIDKQGKDEYSAFMDMIKEYYANNENKLQSQYNKGEISETELQLYRDKNTAYQNYAEGLARNAIAHEGTYKEGEYEGKTFQEAFTSFLADMYKSMHNIGGELNDDVLRRMQKVHDLPQGMRGVGIRANQGKENEDITKWTNDVLANAAKNNLAFETWQSKQFKAIQQALLEYDQVGKVMHQFAGTFQQLGIMFGNLNKDGKEMRVTIREVMQLEKQAAENLYRFNINTAEGMTDFRAYLMSFDEFREGARTASEDQLRLLYYKLYEYNNQYIEARRKADAAAEKISKAIFDNSMYMRQNNILTARNAALRAGTYQHTQQGRLERTSNDKMERRQSPRTGVYGSRSFMEEWAPDLELENYRLKMEASQEYVQQLLREQATEERVRAAQLAADAASMEYVKRLTTQFKAKQDALYNILKPMEAFGQAFGSAMWQLRTSAEDSHEAVREATRAIIKEFAKQTLEMTNQYIQRRMMQTVNDYLVSHQMRRQAAEEVAIANLKKKRMEELQQTGKYTDEQIAQELTTYEGNLRQPKNTAARKALKEERGKIVEQVEKYNEGQKDRNKLITEEATSRVRSKITANADEMARAEGITEWVGENENETPEEARRKYIEGKVSKAKGNGQLHDELLALNAEIAGYDKQQATMRQQADKDVRQQYADEVKKQYEGTGKSDTELALLTNQKLRADIKSGEFNKKVNAQFDKLEKAELDKHGDYERLSKYDQRNFAKNPYDIVDEERIRQAQLNDTVAPTADEVTAAKVDTTNSLLNTVTTQGATTNDILQRILTLLGQGKLEEAQQLINESGIPQETVDAAVDVANTDGNAAERADGTHAALRAANADATSVVRKGSTANAGGEESGESGDGGSDVVVPTATMTVEQQAAEAEKKRQQKEKDDKKDLNAQKKNDKAVTDETKKAEEDQTKIVEKGTEEQTDTTEEGGEAKKEIAIKTGNAVNTATSGNLAENIAMNSAANMANATADMAMTQVKALMGISQGASETIGQLGWWGIPLIAVISATINGLLGAAMSGFSSLFGSSKNNDVKPNTKLVSGMLTYDRGNLQSFRAAIQARTFDSGGNLNISDSLFGNRNGLFDVLGDDGKMYQAVEQAVMQTGLITQPTLTGIGGAPALVGERGPEMVIGRETTRALMTDFPAILKFLTDYDANHSRGFAKTFDNGNLSELSAAISGMSTGSGSGDADQMQQLLEGNRVAMQQLLEVNALLVAQLQKGIKASINKYGPGGLIDEVADGLGNARRLGYNQNVNRLFSGR